MNLFVSVDDDLGTYFNHRRQSRDLVVAEKVAEICNGKALSVQPRTVELFEDVDIKLNIKDNCLPGELGAFCFVEGEPLAEFEDQIETLYLIRWNRKYPSDQKLDLDLENTWKMLSTTDFRGYSHKKITLEVYTHA